MDFSKLHVPALRALCVERGLRSLGLKRLLISRLSDPHFVEPAKPKLVKKGLVVQKTSKAPTLTGKRLRDGARPVVTETVTKLRPATLDDEDDDVDSVDAAVARGWDMMSRGYVMIGDPEESGFGFGGQPGFDRRPS